MPYHFPVVTDFTIFGGLVGCTILPAAPICGPVDFDIFYHFCFFALVGVTSLPFYQLCHFCALVCLAVLPFASISGPVGANIFTIFGAPAGFTIFTNFVLPFYRTYRRYLYASRIVIPPCLF